MEETVLNLDDNKKPLCISGKCDKPLNLHFTNLSFKASGKKGEKGKYILKSLFGKCESGKLTAVLGPSGAGKSSLLNVLSGFRRKGVTGSITVSGKPLALQDFKKNSCYIPQEFALLPLLTTKETLMIAADLKFGYSVNHYRKNMMTNEILRLLSLLKSCDTLVSHLSGGERKRLSIGVELLTNPPIMFLDEPTSGLDSSSAIELMSHLKNLAQDNRTIICVVHQPSSRMFNTFDDIYVLVQGQFVYGGPTVDMVKRFSEYGFECPKYYNPAEFVLEVAKHNEELLLKSSSSSHLIPSKHNEKLAMDVITEENLDESDNETSEKTFGVNIALQCLLLIKRAMICSKRDMHMTYFKLSTNFLTSLLVGVLWFDTGNDAEKVLSNLSAIFILVSAAYALNCLLTVMSYPSEAAAVTREHRNNWYTTHAYFFSKLLAELPSQILSGTLLVIPLYFMTGQPLEMHRFLIVWIVAVLLVIMAQIHGLAFGTLFSTEMSINILIFCAIILSIMSGFPLRIHFIPVFARWFTYMNFLMYALDATITAIYGMDRKNLDCAEAYCYFRSPRKILEEMHMGEYDLKWDIIGLVVWILVFQSIFYFSLKWKHRMSK